MAGLLLYGVAFEQQSTEQGQAPGLKPGDFVYASDGTYQAPIPEQPNGYGEDQGR